MTPFNPNLKWIFGTLLVLGLDIILGNGAGLQLMLNGHAANEPTVLCLAILCLSAGITGLGVTIPKVQPKAAPEPTWVPTLVTVRNADGSKDMHGIRKDGSTWSLRWRDLPELSPRA